MPEYYVAKWGNDGNPGSKAQPWRTIQRACGVAQPGDFVVVLEGQYDERVQINGAGSPGMMITFQADGLVVTKGFTILADWITVRYFEVTDTPNNWRDGFGIYLAGNNCMINDNYIHFATRGGILIEARDTDHISDCILRNNRLYRNAHSGIIVHGRNHLIELNDVQNTIQNHPKWDPIDDWADADGIRFHGSGHIFRSNKIHGMTYDDPLITNAHIDCFQTFTNPEHEAASDILFEKNYCEALTTQAEQENGHCFMLGGASNITIRNNVLKAYGGVNTGAGGNSGLTILNNLFVNDLSFQQFWPKGLGLNDCPNTRVINNIFYDQPYKTIEVTGDVDGNEIHHNFAYRSDGQPSMCYQIDFICVEPVPLGDIWDEDPMFINPTKDNYRLQEGSPAINVGETLPEVNDDYEGNIRPQGVGYDIGPSEYVEGKTNVRSVDEINITNWQETGLSVPIPQYAFDLEVKWTDRDGEKYQHSATYRYPNDIASMPLNVRKRHAEQMIIQAVRVELGINDWKDFA